MRAWLVNGVAGAGVDPADRGLAYGDGLFETLAWRGGAPRLAALHWERLAAGCARLGMPAPPLALIGQELSMLADGAATGTAKVILTRGPGPRGYAPPPAPEPTRLVGFEPRAATAALPREPARVVHCATVAATTPALAGMKTLNRLDNVLARAECRAAGADEGLMADDAGHVIGGTMSNLFIVLDGRLVTPRLDRGGVAGVMRRAVLEEAAALGITAEEAPLGRAQLARAGAAFLTNALVGLWPVGWLAGRALEPADGMVVALARGLARRGVEEAG